MESYFPEKTKKELLLNRLSNFSRIPFAMRVRLMVFYSKRIFGNKGTYKEQADNYYLFTLLNTGTRSLNTRGQEFTFKTDDNTTFKARRWPSSDLDVFNQIWGTKDYIRAVDLLTSLSDTNQPMTIIDAGANVGYSGIYFHKKFPTATIYSIEPDRDNFEMIKKNLTINGIDAVIPIRAAIWKCDTNLKIRKHEKDTREWAFQVEESSDPTDLKGLHINDLIAKYDIKEISLLKIDIEGAESYLFEDETKARQFLAITKVIAMEFHEDMEARENIMRILTDSGFDLYSFNDLVFGSNKKFVG